MWCGWWLSLVWRRAGLFSGSGNSAMKPQTATGTVVPVAYPLVKRIWAPMLIICGLGLTAAWISFWGYTLVTWIERVI
jgi:hypothetical protein